MKKAIFFIILFLLSTILFLLPNVKLIAIGEQLNYNPQELNPEFSHTSGYYNESFYLEIIAKPNTVVYYTLDSSMPNETKNLYTEPILIEEDYVIADGSEVIIQRDIENTPSPEPSYPISMIRSGADQWKTPAKDIFKATIIKVIAYDQELRQSEVLTNSYFVDDNNMSNRYQFPIISLSTDIKNLFDYETGIHVPGIFFDPTIEEGSSNRTGNYYQSGVEWEREVFVEYFNTDGELEFSQNAGLRIHGGLSRKYPIKSYRLYAKDEYDEQNYFNFKFFEDKDIDKFKRIILRAGGQAFQYTFMGEATAQSVLKPLKLDVQYSTPIILFINGEYFGIRNIRDRFDRFHLSTHYDLDPNDVTILVGNSYLEDGDPKGSAHYTALYQFVTLKDMSVKENYQHVHTKMDVDNFIDYYISQIYLANVDWPQNNILYWRKNVVYNKDAQYGHDGLWRWMVYDVDASFGASWGGYYPEINSFERLIGDTWKTGKMFTSLLENDEFKSKFVYRFYDLIDTVFESNRVKNIVLDMISLYEDEMQEHIDRFGYPNTIHTWRSYTNRMVKFAEDRPENVIQHMIDYLNLDNEKYDMTFNYDSQMGNIMVNSLIVDEAIESYTNEFYKDLFMTVEAIPKDGYRFIGWYNPNDDLISLNKKLIIKPEFTWNIEARFEEGEELDENDFLNYTTEIIYASVFTLTTFSVLIYITIVKRKKNLINF
jgi:hypothetical protein